MRVLRLSALLALVVAVAACGGGGNSDPPPPPPQLVHIDSAPQIVYGTQASMEGSAFVPDGAVCCIGPATCPFLPPGYEVSVMNTTTGQPASYVERHLNCLVYATVLWSANVGLSPGPNTIMVTATDGAGRSGSVRTVITRVGATATP